jgi:hypothetical protein
MRLVRSTPLLALLMPCLVAAGVSGQVQEPRSRARSVNAARAKVLLSVARALRERAQKLKSRVDEGVDDGMTATATEVPAAARAKIKERTAERVLRDQAIAATNLLHQLFEDLTGRQRQPSLADVANGVGNELYLCWGLRPRNEQAKQRLETADTMYRFAAWLPKDHALKARLTIEWGIRSLRSALLRDQHQQLSGKELEDLAGVRHACASQQGGWTDADNTRLQAATEGFLDAASEQLAGQIQQLILHDEHPDECLNKWLEGEHGVPRLAKARKTVEPVLRELCGQVADARNPNRAASLARLYLVLSVATRCLPGEAWHKKLNQETFKELRVVCRGLSNGALAEGDKPVAGATEGDVEPDAYAVEVLVADEFQPLAPGGHPYYLPWDRDMVFRVRLRQSSAPELVFLVRFTVSNSVLQLWVPSVVPAGHRVVSLGADNAYFVRKQPMSRAEYEKAFKEHQKLTVPGPIARLKQAEAASLVDVLKSKDLPNDLPKPGYARLLRCLIDGDRSATRALTREVERNEPEETSYVLFHCREVSFKR